MSSETITGIAIVGGGICGLKLALDLAPARHRLRRLSSAPRRSRSSASASRCCPHGMREFAALGLADKLRRTASRIAKAASSIASASSSTRSRAANSQAMPSRKSACIADGCTRRSSTRRASGSGPTRIVTDHDCIGIEQDESGVTLHLRETSTGRAVEPVRAAAAIACDGVNSGVRKSFYPDESLAFAGINTWRGVTRRKPILGGRTYLAHRLDPHRQDRHLSDRRRCRRRGQSAHQLDDRNQELDTSRRTIGTSPAISTTSSSFTRASASIGSTCRR